MAETITFSGWEAMEDRSLSANDEPKSGGTYTMFHGTHLSHAKTIISNGFQQSKDGLLGAGVYVSRNKDKAKCYPLKEDVKNKVVFKLKVDVGKVKKIDSDNHPMQKSWHQNGYDCAWVPPHSNISSIKSGREEDCVWDPKRITIVDVACCVDDNTRRELRKLVQSRSSGQHDVCRQCHQAIPDGQRKHDIERCWVCGKKVCPFQSKHVCKP
ncbi:grass carp reovirus (GCRV)-induced gene 2o [Engraulis encrasicolus]|uniref:grass carp reovirus (GCRV)-induced gene 2o n=1 Tax=Engraulis encrasicolus TaxID=184585 RepID=UPI002FD5D6F1